MGAEGPTAESSVGVAMMVGVRDAAPHTEAPSCPFKCRKIVERAAVGAARIIRGKERLARESSRGSEPSALSLSLFFLTTRGLTTRHFPLAWLPSTLWHPRFQRRSTAIPSQACYLHRPIVSTTALFSPFDLCMYRLEWPLKRRAALSAC